MSGAERTARWRQRRFERQRDAMVALDLEQLPGYVDPGQAEPLVVAWRSRGLQYGITAAQWATIPAGQLGDPEAVDQLVLALEHAPSAPAPASAVWGAVMTRAQQLWRRLRQLVAPTRTAHAYRHPVPRSELEDAPTDGSVGRQAFLEVGRKLWGRAPCGCVCHRDIVSSCERCRSRHREEASSRK